LQKNAQICGIARNPLAQKKTPLTRPFKVKTVKWKLIEERIKDTNIIND